jgi:hypothetical protein
MARKDLNATLKSKDVYSATVVGLIMPLWREERLAL